MRKLLTLTIAVLSAAMAFAEGEPVIKAWRSTVNTADKTSFASMYVSDLGATITGNPGYATGKVSYLWEKSADGSTGWAEYADGLGSKTDNIRPIKGGYYRCVVTLKPKEGDNVVVNSNSIQVTASAGAAGPSISSNIPVISIRTDAQAMPNCDNPLANNTAMFEAKAKRSADCKIIWNKQTTDGSTAIYDGDDFDAHNGLLYYDKKIRINYRGSSSMTKNRKNYAFACGDDNTGTAGKWVKGKEKMFSLSDKKDKDWILYSSFDDGTFMRNQLQLDLYEEMSMNWNSHGRYARVYVDGVDKGLYIFMEKNKQSEARIDVEEDGFIFKYDKTDKVDRYENPESITLSDGTQVEQTRSTFISSYIGQLNVQTYNILIDHAFEIVYPEYSDFDAAGWAAKVQALKDKISAVETAVKNNNYSTLRTLIDYESFADYFIIEEFAKNVDGYRISQFFKYNTNTAKLKAEPLWDTELGLGNHEGSVNDQNLLAESSRVKTDDFPIPFWWTGYTGGGKHGKSGTDATGEVNKAIHIGSSNGLLGDACFKAKVKQRWAQHTAAGGPLTEANISSKLTTYATSSGMSSSEFSSWVSGNNSRFVNLGAVINGWTVPTYVNSVSANFDGEESTVLEKHVNMEGSVTMEVSATAGQGSSPTLYYSWQRSDDGQTNWVTLVDDVTTTSQTFDNIQESGYYRARAKSSECDCIKYSSSNVLHVIVDQVKVVCE